MKQRPKEVPQKPRRDHRRWFFLILAGTSCWLIARLNFIQPYSERNGRFFVGEYRFTEDPWDHPKLRQLRRQERLDDVTAPGLTQFDKIVLLRRWTRHQWESAPTFYYPPWDALEILDLARRKSNYGFCAQYSIVFLQACRAMGLHARYVDLGHFLTAVWSDDFNKWVIMDPTNDVHFEKDGIPLNGMSLNEISWANHLRGVEKVRSDGSRTPAPPEELKLFRNYSVILNNDQLTKPVQVSDNGKRGVLIHQDDYRNYPKFGRDTVGLGADFLAWEKAENPPPWPGRKRTTDPDNFKNALNQTIIFVVARSAERGLVKLKLLSENAPEFKEFRIKIDSQPYADLAGSHELLWTLAPGVNVLTARLKTQAGWLGPESEIRVYYKPNWLAGKDGTIPARSSR